MGEPHHSHWIAAKNLLRYLQGIIHYGLRYNVGNLRLHGYLDTDWASNVVDCKNMSECCFSLGFASISWTSRKQKSVAVSTTEAGHIAASLACCEAIWLRKLFCDNQSGIQLIENPVFHDRSKHFDIRYHFIWDMVQWGAIRLQHIRTEEHVAYILTKPLEKVKFLTF